MSTKTITKMLNSEEGLINSTLKSDPTLDIAKQKEELLKSQESEKLKKAQESREKQERELEKVKKQAEVIGAEVDKSINKLNSTIKEVVDKMGISLMALESVANSFSEEAQKMAKTIAPSPVQKVEGKVDATVKFPDVQKVEANFPDKQKVEGKVEATVNFPDIQKVKVENQIEIPKIEMPKFPTVKMGKLEAVPIVGWDGKRLVPFGDPGRGERSVSGDGKSYNALERLIAEVSGDNSIDHDHLIHYAIQEIQQKYNTRVSVELKRASLLKFGRNEDTTNATTGSSVMDLPSGVAHETYISTNGITTISSASAGDTQQIVIEGATISGNDLTPITQTVTLNGQNQVTLPTALARVCTAYNNGATDLTGPVYVYETDTTTAGVPDTASKVHIIIPSAKNTSRKACNALGKNEFWIVTSVAGSVLEKTATFAELSFQHRQLGKVFRTFDIFSMASSGGEVQNQYNPYIIVPRNSDVRVVAVGSAASLDVAASIHGYLATII